MTEQPEWLSKYQPAPQYYPPSASCNVGDVMQERVAEMAVIVCAAVSEIAVLHDRIARLEAGQRDLEARLGDGE